MAFRGALAGSSPFQKLLFFTGITLFSTLIFTFISFIISRFAFGINLFTDPSAFDDLGNPAVLKSMKIMQLLAGGIGMFIIPAAACAYFFSENGKKYLPLKTLPVLLSVFFVIIIAFTSIPIINWMVELNNRLSLPASLSFLEQWMKTSEQEAARITEAFLQGSSTTALLSNLFIVALIPAIGEEFFFRGILQRLFTDVTKNVHWGILITSILFSAIHLQFYGFLPRMMLGILLGYLLLWSGSLWLPILAHFVNNAGAVILVFLQNRNAIEFNPDTIGTASDERIMLIVSVVLTAGLLFLVYKAEKNKELSVS